MTPEEYYAALEEKVSTKVFKSVKRTVRLGDVEFKTIDYSFKNIFNEDKLYADPKYRMLLPRGCCITFACDKQRDDKLSDKLTDKPVHALTGHPKFGYDGDYTVGVPMDTIVRRVYTQKENGQCGHVSAFRYEDEPYLVIGSKNVHLVVRA